MYCRECGAELREGATFCTSCGAKVALKEAEQDAIQNAEIAETPEVVEEEKEPVINKEELAEKADAAKEQALVAAAAAGDKAKELSGKAIHGVKTFVNGPDVPAEKKYLRGEPHNKNVPMSYDKKEFKKPAEYKNLFVYFILMLVTFGIYFLYQIHRLTKLSNEDESMTKRSPGVQVLLCIILPYVYWIYWAYQTGKRIENILKERTGKMASIAAPSLILSFFGLDVIALIIMQDKVNKYVGGITGTNMEADGLCQCKECGIYFPNDITECPNCGEPYQKQFYENKYFRAGVMAVVAILFITIIASVATSCNNSRSYSSYGYYYSYIAS
ncbi:MAG: DUF4234 domain-containing protein [Clostridia bacterium]|nr:DUF4234 domain-containing protein [Clostridia bacterium]